MIKVTSKYEAWKVVNGYLGETKLDEEASERAGYEIYKNDKGEWVSDLGSRFEITTLTETVNVWFDDGETKPGTKSVTVYYRGLNDIVCSKKIKGVKNIAFYNKPDQVAVWTDISKSTFYTDKLVSIQYDD